MVPSILLALTVIVLTIDVLVGIHRGFGFGIIRLGVWLVGTVISIFAARSVTVWLLFKIAGVPNMEFYVSQEYGNWIGSYKSTIGNHLTGLKLSFMVSVVFVGLFLISKFITWIIYLFLKSLIKKSAKRASAHNAAVDAVTAIKATEVSDAAINELEKPYDTDAVLLSGGQDNEEGFGTFGIYPKEDKAVKNENIPEDELLTEAFFSEAGKNTDAAEADTSDELSLEASESLETSSTEDSKDDEEEPENSGDNSGDESDSEDDSEKDGFESIAAGQEDGFESLARSMAEEKPAVVKPKKEKKVKEKPVKVKPVKEKILKRKHSFAVFIIQESRLSKVLGGILGLFMGLFACAIITSPFLKLLEEIPEDTVAEAVVDLAFMLSQPDAKNIPAKAFEKGGEKPIVAVPSYFDIGSDFSLRKADFVEAITSMDESIVHYVYKYTGADFVSSVIYDCLKTIKPGDVGLKDNGIDSYCLPATIKCYSEVLPDLNNMVSMLNEKQGVSVELVDSIEKGVLHLFEITGPGAVLTDKDKLALANGIIERFNEKLQVNIDLGAKLDQLTGFNDYGEVKEGLKERFETIRALISNGYF